MEQVEQNFEFRKAPHPATLCAGCRCLSKVYHRQQSSDGHWLTRTNFLCQHGHKWYVRENCPHFQGQLTLF